MPLGRHSLGPRPRSGAAPLRRPTGRVFSWAPGPHPASPLQRRDSSRVPRCPRADRPRAAAAQREAAISIAGRPQYFQGAARIQECRRSAPPQGASSLGPLGPHRLPRSSGETRPESPAVFGPSALKPRQSAACFGRATRPPALVFAAGPISPLGTFRGRHRGPITPGYRRQRNPSARTPIGPEKVRFLTFSRRPLRSEKFRRPPSPGPWPRPLGVVNS
ncbi:hypothetical protein NDU88_005016 [Pleurodeles waltl]|uniref:Uncharacterized protein n=1 Tax=Pleurodeles waltl TaxID=8319 RepID=A0AAV7LK08_PLEWA|nr:hypothetical protein NDU88_005016 [Pleurodeles waltl]